METLIVNGRLWYGLAKTPTAETSGPIIMFGENSGGIAWESSGKC